MQYKYIVILAQVLSLQTIALVHSSLFEVEHESKKKKKLGGGGLKCSRHLTSALSACKRTRLFGDIVFFC